MPLCLEGLLYKWRLPLVARRPPQHVLVLDTGKNLAHLLVDPEREELVLLLLNRRALHEARVAATQRQHHPETKSTTNALELKKNPIIILAHVMSRRNRMSSAFLECRFILARIN